MSATRDVPVDAGRFTIRVPGWPAWRSALQRAAEQGPADVRALLAEALLTAVHDAGGRPLTRPELEALPAEDGDALLIALADALEAERQALNLQVREGPGGAEVEGHGVQLRLRPWSFGERNEALRRALRLTGGQVTVDLVSFEMGMVQGCVTGADGRPAAPGDMANWPVALGDAVVDALDRLNGLGNADEAILQACLQTGLDHPDLALLRLCRTFGWTPAEAAGIDAGMAQRLLAALRAAGEPAPTGGVRSAPTKDGRWVPSGEGVTRILVRDEE